MGLLMAGCSDGPSSEPRPNLLLVSIDTLRADHLGCYGYDRPTSPFLNRLAERDGMLLFEQCIAQSSTTAPSHMTLMTSLYPVVHGVPNIPPKDDVGLIKLPKETKTLARVLAGAGYRTAAVVDGGYLEPVFGFESGFESYDCAYEGVASKVDKTLAQIEKLSEADEPWFFFMHTYEVHAPFLPPSPYRERFTSGYDGWVRAYCEELDAAEDKRLDGFSELFKRRGEFDEADVRYLIGMYDGGIAFTDRELERLFNGLEKGGHLSDLVVVIVSDHGEEFGEHGEFSHKNLYDNVVHVPLMILLPEALQPRMGADPGAKRVPWQVGLIDVMPTMLQLAGVNAPPYLQGRSLVPLFEGGGEDAPAFSEVIDYGPDPLCHGIRLGRYKVLNYASGEHYELFDLEADQGERENRAAEPPREAKELLHALDDQRKINQRMRDLFRADQEKGVLPPEIEKNLRELGY